MGDLTEIIISVVDQASSVFDQIGSSAEGSFSDVSSAADQASSSMDQVEVSSDSAGNALDSVDGTSLDQASTSADEAATSLDEAANSAEGAGAATESISDQALQEAASSANSLGAGFDEVTTKADEAANSASEVGKNTSDAASIGTTGMLGATVAVAGMTVGLEGAAEWADTTNASFDKMSSAKLPEDELRSMVAAMTNVNFPTEDALLYIKTLKQTGQTATESLNNGAIAFNTIAIGTGVASDRVVTFSNSMVAMGMDMSNIPAAYNAIAYANANMVGGFDTYINWMQKYDSTFKEMGLNIDQTAVLVSAATQKFGGGRAAYTGLNEAIKASNGDLSVLEQQLGMQPGALVNASAATAAYGGKLENNTRITNEHTTILQQAKAYLTDLATQYGDVIGVVGSFGGILGSSVGIITAAATAKTALATSAIANVTATSAESGALTANTAAENTNILAKARSRLASIANVVTNYSSSSALMTAAGAAAAHAGAVTADTAAENTGLASKIRGTAATVASTVATGARTAITYAAATAQWALNAAMDANPIMIVVLAIMALVAILFYLYNTNETVRGAIDWLWASLQALGSYIMGGLIAAWNALTTALSPITTALGLLWAAISKVWSAFAGGQMAQANGAFSQIAGAVMALWNALSWLASIIISAIMPYLRVLWTFLSGTFMAVWRTISGVILDVINFIAEMITIFALLISGNITLQQAFQMVWTSIQNLILNISISILTGIGEFAASLINYGIQAASGLLNNFIAYISQLPGMAWGYFLAFLGYLASLPGSAAGYAASVGSTIVSTIANYLTSLPGQMYSWGMNALSRFVNGIIDAIPGLRSALDTVSSLFPHSPPKEGPLATIKDENMELFGSSLTESMSEGLEEGAGDSFGFISGDSVTVSKKDNSSGSVSEKVKELKVTLVHDFINVPQDINKAELLEALKGMTYDLGWIDTLVKTLSYGKVITKANLG